MQNLADVIPRWQWRTFGGDDLTSAAACLEAGLGAPETSEEAHIISPRPDVSTRVRGNELDVKVMRRAEDGLEQWAPILHARFPISLCLVTAVFAAWHRATPAAMRPSYTWPEFEDLVRNAGDLMVIPLQKIRRAGRFEECLTEASRLVVGGTHAFTLALKQENPATVLETLRRLGLAGRENLNYVRALRRWRREHPEFRDARAQIRS
jgi:hypothetical protein